MGGPVESFDMIFVGSGAGGVVGAFTAARRGLKTLLIEKADVAGGTTCYSGAGIWFPGSGPTRRAGTGHDVDAAREYLRTIVGDPSREERQDAYLEAGVRVIDELEADEHFGEFRYGRVPDYFDGAPGAIPQGHTIFPPEIAAAEVGDLAGVIRPHIPAERWGEPREEVFSGGRALVARALKGLLASGNGTLRLGTALDRLVVEGGRVVGIVAVSDGAEQEFRATKGVVLAAGGFEYDRELREEHQPGFLEIGWSNGAPTNTGDALRAGLAVGAAVDLLDEAWFVPGVVQPDGRPLFHTGTRGGIWVNAAGRRFVNELAPYDQAGHAIVHAHRESGISHIPAYWILDQRQLDRDNLGAPPGEPLPAAWIESGALRRADSVHDLATIIGAPAETLRATIERFNSFEASGVDEDFHRGQTPWDKLAMRAVGYPWMARINQALPLTSDSPNPLVVALEPPYYVATILPSDIGTKGGLVTDADSRVLREDGTPIPGLYAAGNCASPMSGRVYPGAGSPVGTSIAFAYRAVLDVAALQEA